MEKILSLLGFFKKLFGQADLSASIPTEPTKSPGLSPTFKSAQGETPAMQPAVAKTPVAPVVNSADPEPTVSAPVEEVKPLKPQANITAGAPKEISIPEDSTLKRHYLSGLELEKAAISNPYPTDSTLRRHYESMLAASLKTEFAGTCIPVTVAPVGETEPLIVSPVDNITARIQPEGAEKFSVPEDATLRRHFLSKLQAEIAELLPPKPTDSTLKRHYEALLQARLGEYLNS